MIDNNYNYYILIKKLLILKKNKEKKPDRSINEKLFYSNKILNKKTNDYLKKY